MSNKPAILYVYNDEDDMLILQEILAEINAAELVTPVRYRNSFKETAFDQVPENIGLIVTDFNGAHISCRKFISEVTLLPQCAGIPLVVLASSMNTSHRELCLGAGASDFVVKPMGYGQFCEMIRTWTCNNETVL